MPGAPGEAGGWVCAWVGGCSWAIDLGFCGDASQSRRGP